MCGGGLFVCMCVGREEVLGDNGERIKFYGHAFNVNEFAVEH